MWCGTTSGRVGRCLVLTPHSAGWWSRTFVVRELNREGDQPCPVFAFFNDSAWIGTNSQKYGVYRKEIVDPRTSTMEDEIDDEEETHTDTLTMYRSMTSSTGPPPKKGSESIDVERSAELLRMYRVKIVNELPTLCRDKRSWNNLVNDRVLLRCALGTGVIKLMGTCIIQHSASSGPFEMLMSSLTIGLLVVTPSMYWAARHWREMYDSNQRAAMVDVFTVRGLVARTGRPYVEDAESQQLLSMFVEERCRERPAWGQQLRRLSQTPITEDNAFLLPKTEARPSMRQMLQAPSFVGWGLLSLAGLTAVCVCLVRSWSNPPTFCT